MQASEETRGLRPKVYSGVSLEPAREAAMKVRRLHQAEKDLGATNNELK